MSTETRFRYREGFVAEKHVPPGGGSRYKIFSKYGELYEADYSDIMTDGFRTLTQGERVRFLPDEVNGKRVARYIIRANADQERLYYAS